MRSELMTVCKVRRLLWLPTFWISVRLYICFSMVSRQHNERLAKKNITIQWLSDATYWVSLITYKLGQDKRHSPPLPHPNKAQIPFENRWWLYWFNVFSKQVLSQTGYRTSLIRLSLDSLTKQRATKSGNSSPWNVTYLDKSNHLLLAALMFV